MMTEMHQTDLPVPRPDGGESAHPPPAAPAGATDPAAAHRRANRDLWDAWTRLHLRLPAGHPTYDVAAFKAGRTTLAPIERAEVGDVAGTTLLHLQCHFGLDTLSWAREGAAVTGADFSPEAVAAARALSAETGVPGRFVCADLYALPDLPELRAERFDVVFTSYGVLSWLPDLAGWARVVARFLRPGGVFYMVEHHPVMRLLDPETHDSAGHALPRGYFHRPRPVRAEYSGSYAAPEAEEWTTAYFWDHPLGEVVTALCATGLRLEFLHEHPRPAGATFHADYPDDLPYLFSLRATAPPDPPDPPLPPAARPPEGRP
jgi:SAM-dependent methyltransferase